jgi:hypothetical protein
MKVADYLQAFHPRVDVPFPRTQARTFSSYLLCIRIVLTRLLSHLGSGIQLVYSLMQYLIPV